MFRKGTVSLTTSIAKQTQSKNSSTKIISFVGDMEKNIQEIINSLSCTCGCKF